MPAHVAEKPPYLKEHPEERAEQTWPFTDPI